jgi:hypothetical protein
MVPNAIFLPLNDDGFDALMQQDLSKDVGFQRLMATLQDNTDRPGQNPSASCSLN